MTMIDTKLGPVEVHPTHANHIHISTESGTPGLTVRGVPYHISAHLYLWADGTWHLGREGEAPYKQSESLYASRTDRYTEPRDLYASRPARKALTAAIETAMNAWAQTKEAQETIDAGARHTAELDLSIVRSRLDKMRAELAELESEERTLLALLRP